MNQPDNEKLAAALVGGTPMAFKAYPDGSLVVIAPDGRKYRFTAQAVEEAVAKLTAATAPKRTSSSSNLRKTFTKPASGSGKQGPKQTAESNKNPSKTSEDSQ